MRQVYNVESPPSSMLFDTSSIEASGSGGGAVARELAKPSAPSTQYQAHPQPQSLPQSQSSLQSQQHMEQPELKPQLRQAYPTRLTLANLIPSRFAFHFEVYHLYVL